MFLFALDMLTKKRTFYCISNRQINGVVMLARLQVVGHRLELQFWVRLLLFNTITFYI